MIKQPLFILLVILSYQVVAQDFNRISYRQQCLEIEKYLIKDRYQLHCNYSYHHYNALSSHTYYQGNDKPIRIGSFNLFNPGNSQTFYKDYELIAKIIDDFDIIAAVELLPVVGEDLDHNESVIDFIASGPELLEELQKSNPTEMAQLQADLAKAPSLYRKPGYLKILDELQKLDPSWSLLITPRGQGSSSSNVQELAGFYYRARKVKTTLNDYCKDFVTNHIGSPVACIPNFGEAFLGQELRQVFSRRPFIASFESGHFKFSLLVSHVIFTSPKDQESMEEILLPTFGVSDYHQLGTGVIQDNYARFAEIQATLTFMRRLRQHYPQQKLILMGDLNLQADNPFWSQLLHQNGNYQLFVTEATSTTKLRFRSDGGPTHGYASNYDHFIYDPNETSECSKAARYDFYKLPIAKLVNERYLVRSSTKMIGPYPIIAPDKITLNVEKLRQKLQQRETIKYNKVVWDDYKFSYRLSSMKRRLFNEQQYDRTYYRLFTEILSDHAPISLHCRTK